MFKRSRIGALAALLAVLLIAAGCGSDDTSSNAGGGEAPEGDPIVIGIQTDKTGGAAEYNVQPTELVKALIERQNANGGLLGRPIKVVEGNDESDPTKAPTVLQKLYDEGARAVFFHSGGAAIVQAKPLTVELGLPVFASTNSTEAVQGPPDNDVIYTLGLPSTVWSKVYCNGMSNAGIKRLGILMDDSPTIAGFSEAVLSGMDCIEVVTTETAAVDAPDLAPQIARLKKADIDAVMTFALGNAFEIAAQNALFQQMPEMPRFMTAVFGNSPDAWKIADPGALEGAVFMATVDPTNERTKKVEAEMKELMGDDFPMNGFTAQTWDAYHLLIKAIEDAGTDDPAAVNEAIQNISGYDASFGLPGLTISYNETKRNGPDSDCGLLLVEFGADNTPSKVYEPFKSDC